MIVMIVMMSITFLITMFILRDVAKRDRSYLIGSIGIAAAFALVWQISLMFIAVYIMMTHSSKEKCNFS